MWTSPPHQIMMDEAQSFGLPIDAIPLAADKKHTARWRNHWGIIHLGDPFQPHGASPAPAMQLVLAELFRRSPGIRHEDVRFLPPREFLAEIRNMQPPAPSSSSQPQEHAEDGSSSAVDIGELASTTSALLREVPGCAPASLELMLGHGAAYPALMIHSSVRLHPLTYVLMILAGYPSGVQVAGEHSSLIGTLHPLQALRTKQGLRSGITPGGKPVAGIVWFDTTALGDKSQVEKAPTWIPVVESTLALLFYMFAESMGQGDLVGILVTWTHLSTQLQRGLHRQDEALQTGDPAPGAETGQHAPLGTCHESKFRLNPLTLPVQPYRHTTLSLDRRRDRSPMGCGWRSFSDFLTPWRPSCKWGRQSAGLALPLWLQFTCTLPTHPSLPSLPLLL